MYQSLSSRNDFGRFLLSHFESLGAPILTWINEHQIIKRFKNILQFDDIELINMKHFWRKTLMEDERERDELIRVDNIEPFDEWEELDNVCASYCLTIARREVSSVLSSKIMPVKTDDSLKAEPENYFHHSEIRNPYFPSKIYQNLLHIFSHCSSFDSKHNRIQIFGGFGIEVNKSFVVDNTNVDGQKSFTRTHTEKVAPHRRCVNIVELQLDDQNKTILQVNVLKPFQESTQQCSYIPRMHSRAVPLEENRCFISGGRTSPNTIQPNAIVEMSSSSNFYQFRIEPEFNLIESKPFPNSFRHVCTRFGHESNRLIQFGGMRSMVGDDDDNGIYIFNLETFTWTKIGSSSTYATLDTKRHSIACTSINSNSIILNGGLDIGAPRGGNFRSKFECFEILDNRENIVHSWNLSTTTTNQFQPLYSHQLSLINDHHLLCVGGIGRDRIENSIYRIDLRSHQIIEHYDIVYKNNDQYLMSMMHNFTCETLTCCGRGRICLIGGGGNCFSFGTHFNPIVFYDF